MKKLLIFIPIFLSSCGLSERESATLKARFEVATFQANKSKIDSIQNLDDYEIRWHNSKCERGMLHIVNNNVEYACKDLCKNEIEFYFDKAFASYGAGKNADITEYRCKDSKLQYFE